MEQGKQWRAVFFPLFPMDFFKNNAPELNQRKQLNIFYFNLILQWLLLAAVVTLPNVVTSFRVWLQQNFWYFQIALIGPIVTFFWTFQYFAFIYFNWLCGCILFVSWEAYVKEFIIAQFVYTVIVGLIVQQILNYWKRSMLGYATSLVNIAIAIVLALLIEFIWTRYEWILIVGMGLSATVFLGYIDRYVHRMLIINGEVKRQLAYVHQLFVLSILRNFVYEKTVEKELEEEVQEI